MEVERHIAEQKDENNPMGSWLRDNLVAKKGSTVHVHRFDKAYKKWQTEQELQRPVPRTGFIDMLGSLGHHLSAADDKVRDLECCQNSFRYVRDIDVQGWSERGLKKEH